MSLGTNTTVSAQNNYAVTTSAVSALSKPPTFQLAQEYKSAYITGPGRNVKMIDYQGLAGNNVMDLGYGTGPTLSMNQMLLRNYLEYSGTKKIPSTLYQDYRPLEHITTLDEDPYKTVMRSFTQIPNPNPLVRRCAYNEDI
jgi:hypothetical protein